MCWNCRKLYSDSLVGKCLLQLSLGCPWNTYCRSSHGVDLTTKADSSSSRARGLECDDSRSSWSSLDSRCRLCVSRSWLSVWCRDIRSCKPSQRTSQSLCCHIANSNVCNQAHIYVYQRILLKKYSTCTKVLIQEFWKIQVLLLSLPMSLCA